MNALEIVHYERIMFCPARQHDPRKEDFE